VAVRSAFGSALKKLQDRYGEGALPEPRDPFGLIVWENAAYLVSDDVRSSIVSQLRKTIGLTPAALLSAPPSLLQQAIRSGGMQPVHRAEKVIRCAEIAIDSAGGNLKRALRGLTPAKSRALLKRFPGIAEPGADKVLLLCGLSEAPSLDSNGLRVLTRLGFIAEDGSYARAYRAGVSFLSASGITGEKAVAAFALLREHGRQLCKRTAPLCALCPLQKSCEYALSRRRCAL
jgi:endonuclease-3